MTDMCSECQFEGFLHTHSCPWRERFTSDRRRMGVAPYRDSCLPSCRGGIAALEEASGSQCLPLYATANNEFLGRCA